MSPPMTIIGAGLGGLTCALALLRAGLAVRVFEQAPVLGEVGAGITMSPNASRVLIHLGLGPELERLGYVPERQWTQVLTTGAVLVDKLRGPDMAQKYGAPYVHVHRADLHGLLADAVLAHDPAAIHLDYKLETISINRGISLGFANGALHDADVVIGADGVKSVVRDQMFKTLPPQFTGQVAWRGIVPIERLPAEVAALPPGIHIGDKRLFMRYPVRHGALLNYAAFVNLEGWSEEGWAIRSTIDELIGHYHDAEPAVLAIIRATPEDQLFKWALHAREPLDSWVAGRVTLLGDAAHGMLPFMGQGAASAIEDGMVLARCLAAFPAEEALQRYEAARRDYTTRTQTQSRLLGLQFQGKDPASFGKGPILNEETMGLFAYDATEVSI
jgi:salicylate hydroxylase